MSDVLDGDREHVVDKKDDDPIARYVGLLGGRRPIRKVLIANNGIAAVKAIRSIRRWSYETFGDEHAVEFVAMATPEDVTANAEYVRMADMWTSVPGGSNNHNFANVDLIADIADRYSCDAVWAGWGHASENPALPRTLAALGITFMGPNADSMHALGDKIASTIIAQSANVPTVAWSGQGLTVDYKSTGCIPDDIYKSACVESAEQALQVAETCGYPVVIKASEGGGGKGIRVVLEQAALQPAFRHVAGEIPGSPIFVMRLVKNARHLEVQIVADEYGDAVALHGRDCSIQRRHQKIIEEGPVIAAPPHVWKKLEIAAVALAKAVGYVGAGTVEYLYTGDTSGGKFYFLELNPRLQVEHPVTEWISGVNLPALQLHIAMGIPLKNVPCIRRFFGVADQLVFDHQVGTAGTVQALRRGAGPDYLVDGIGDDEAGDFIGKTRPKVFSESSPTTTPSANADASSRKDATSAHACSIFDRDPVPPRGHVIACRVTAENPDEGFQPTSGAIQELMFRNTPNVWGYFSVGASGGVHEFADSQFGHLFAWGETRESSRRSLVLALKELSIRGDIRTTVEYLIKLLEMKDFRENRIHTAWLDALIAEKITAERPPTGLAVVIGAVCRAQLDFKARADVFTKCLERGQLPALDRSLVEYPVELIYDDKKYSLRVTRADVSAFRVRLAENDLQSEPSVLADVQALADGAVLVLLDGRSHVCYAREEPAGMRLTIDGKTCLFPKEYDPATLTSSVSGKLVRFLVADGDHVEQERPYAELEVMKMYLTLHAPESGRISLAKPAGSSIDVGDIVATLDLDDPTKVRRSEKFTGKLPQFGLPQAIGTKPHQKFDVALKNVELLVRGFDADRTSLKTLMNLIDDPRVAAGELQEALSSLSGRISSPIRKDLEAAIGSILMRHASTIAEQNGISANCSVLTEEGKDEDQDERSDDSPPFDLSALSSVVANIKRTIQNIPDASALLSVAMKYEDGSVLAKIVSSLLDQYIEVERPFVRSQNSPGDVLFEMRDANRGDLASLVEVAASHVQVKVKNEMVVTFLQVLRDPSTIKRLRDDTPHVGEVKARLHQLSQLFAPSYADIALSARIVLADLSRPHFHHRHSTVARLLADVSSASLFDRAQKMQNIVSLSESILDVLMAFSLPFDSIEVSRDIRCIAAEVQILRSYRAYDVSQFAVTIDESESATLTATWRFRFAKPERVVSSPCSLTSNHCSTPPHDMSPSHLPQAPSHLRGISSFDSADNLSGDHGGASCASEIESYRIGMLAAFSNWSDLASNFDDVLEKCTSQVKLTPGADINAMTVLLRWDFKNAASALDPSNGSTAAIPHIADPLVLEQQVSSTLVDFCRSNPSRHENARAAGLKTITFIVAPTTPAGQSVMYPGFFTFRVRDNFQEDPIFRHIDPPMAYQLELSRLSNFDITKFGYPNRSIHVFFAQDKSVGRLKGTAVTGKSGRTEASGKLGDGGQPSSLFINNTEVVRNSRSCNVNVSSHEQSDPVPSGKLPPTAPGVPFKISNPSEDFHVAMRGRKDSQTNSNADRDVDARFFVRAVIRNLEVFSSANDAVVSIPEAERTFCEALDAVEMASCDSRFRRTDCNHIFLNVIPTVRIDVEDVQKICRRLFMRFAARCWLLRVFVVEVKVSTFSSEGSNSAAYLPLRLLLFNPTGHVLRVESYVESTDRSSGNVHIESLSPADQGSLDGTLVSEPYQIMDRIQRKRVVAKTIETAYVYDFMQLFTKQLQSRWRQYSEDRLLGGFKRHKVPITPMHCIELVLGDERGAGGEPILVPTNRPPGLNDIGMVAWRCTLCTPEFPTGRDIIVIANDITFLSGSFGPDEDDLFLAASKLARREGIPRIYLAANSGARIGIASEVRDLLQVSWVDPSDPVKGFNCLAISQSDAESIKDSITTGRILENGMVEITSIVGAGHGLGVENLMGSGLIAGESSAAYDETFTLTYVTARSVGIGAYLVRLGQRVIQKENAAPIILTGFSALNKVLGHDVYLSNDQLGGTKIMHPNGITHLVVQDDVHGISAVLDWLSFVPAARGHPLPIIESRDVVTREIEVSPPPGGQPYDPRVNLICGGPSLDGGDGFLGGFFDKYSWRESLDSWAKTVVVGRARLGGVPTGVIAVETRSVERVTPADPASPETHESIVVQAGQVWYPDSAAKTARAIKDLDREGLPLFILANWRGFSGGMRDMYDEILKAGSEIVDALRVYKQPVFVYIPPGGELRGGAWVVLDTLINPEQIEMYADPTARGGVLEPEGTVDVKYRRRDLLNTMHRLDPVLRKLDAELKAGDDLIGLLMTDEPRRSIHDAIYAREAEILPSYKNIATAFCDLHDMPERLVAKGAIRRVVPWREARNFFYWRLQRRLAENRIRSTCSAANRNLTSEQITNLLRRWAAADISMETDSAFHHDSPSRTDKIAEDKFAISKQSFFDTDDKRVFQWLEVEEDTILQRIDKLRVSQVAEDIAEMYRKCPDGFLNGIEKVLQGSSDASETTKLASVIQARVEQATTHGSSSNSRSILPPYLLSRFRGSR
jgi:biotin carboxylase/acetyl-CoA carboxylase carboxyltransferase component/biotin carboxyl carrier protein